MGAELRGQTMEDFTDKTTTTYQFANTSRIKRMLWIGFYTLLFNILTLTLFRFWGRTHFRRQLWSDTTVEGEAFEYTGTGKELFIGFFIAIFTVMLPTFGTIFLAQLLLEPTAAVFVILALYIVLFWLIGVAIFLARRYVLSRTRYRGIRFEQTGSASQYGLNAFGYGFLTSITLGWFGPAARIRLSKYMWSRAYFGDKKIDFTDTPEAKEEPVYSSFALMWIGGLVLYFLFFGAIYALGLYEGLAVGSIEATLTVYALAIPFGLLFSLISAWHSTVMVRRIIKSLSLEGSKATCDLTTLQLLKVWLASFGLIIITLGIGTLAARMMAWRVIANHTRFEGEIDFASIAQAASTGPKQGEGIADGFDIGAGF